MLNKYPDKGIVFPFPTCKLFFHLFTEHNLQICTISGSTVSTMLSQRLTALWSECALVRPVLWELCPSGREGHQKRPDVAGGKGWGL